MRLDISSAGGRGVRSLSCVAIGFAVGAGTLFGQSVMPGQFNTLVNSGVVWVVPVFVAGSILGSRWSAGVIGLLMMVATVAGYFLTAAYTGAPVSTFSVVLWCAVALVAGPAFGLGGAWWRHGGRWERVAGTALLGAVFLAEGLFLLVANRHWWSGSALIAVGLLGSLLMARREDRAVTVLALPLLVIAATGVYFLVDWVFSLRVV